MPASEGLKKGKECNYYVSFPTLLDSVEVFVANGACSQSTAYLSIFSILTFSTRRTLTMSEEEQAGTQAEVKAEDANAPINVKVCMLLLLLLPRATTLTQSMSSRL
jgi:hypothetical protein